MTTVALASNSITRSQYEATLNQPMHRITVLLRQDCPGCGGLLRQTGFADWVKDHSIVVTLWNCTQAPHACQASALNTTFRLETAVVDDATGAVCKCEANYVPMTSGHPHTDCVEGFCPCRPHAQVHDGTCDDEGCGACYEATR